MFKKAFTLAEVLITIGIIGIIAAFTIPLMISHYNKVVMSARNKKFVSSINQAILRSIVDHEEPYSWAANIKYHNSEALYDWFDEYIMQYMNVLKNCRKNSTVCVDEYSYCETEDICFGSGVFDNSYVLYILNDGSMIIALTGGSPDEEGVTLGLTLHIRFDANGYAKPNMYGKDIFSYRFTVDKSKFYVTCDTHKDITGGTVSLDNSRAELIESCKTNPQTCSCLLMKDNYEFKRDYPFRL